MDEDEARKALDDVTYEQNLEWRPDLVKIFPKESRSRSASSAAALHEVMTLLTDATRIAMSVEMCEQFARIDPELERELHDLGGAGIRKGWADAELDYEAGIETSVTALYPERDGLDHLANDHDLLRALTRTDETWESEIENSDRDPETWESELEDRDRDRDDDE